MVIQRVWGTRCAQGLGVWGMVSMVWAEGHLCGYLGDVVQDVWCIYKECRGCVEDIGSWGLWG